ncbi:hypothetical protein ARZXY2_1474 [Arthrobacter sp. ZXY-2]|nr:hypothetical protein ARZXY2_1474 [Arthrobacter sp. ZXY-2]
MARPIEIPIAIDADGVDKGAAKVSDAFEKVEDNLKDVAKAGDKAGKDVADSMDDAAKKIDRDLTKALKDVESEARNSGKGIGDGVKRGTDKASEGFSEMKDEAASTAKESAASFGSIEDSADALQEILANAAAGFGPMGAAVGIALAIGVGLLTSSLQESADKINENKEKMLDLAQTLKDKGGDFDMGDAIQAMDDYGFSIQDTKEWWEFFQQDAVSGFEELRNRAEAAGISIGDAFRGQFGELEDAKKVSEQLTGKLKELEDQTRRNGIQVDEFGRVTESVDPAMQKQISGTKELSDKVKDHIKNLEAAAEIERIRRAAIEGTTEATLEDLAALQKRNETIQGGITTELDYWEQVAETTKTLEENGKTLDKTTQAGRDNTRALIDQSNAAKDMATSQLEAGTSADQVAVNLANQREALLLQLDAMTGSRAESEKLAESLGLLNKDFIAEVKTNGVAESKTEIETIPATTDTTVNVSQTGAEETQARINSVQGKEVKVDVDDEYTVKEVQNRIDGIRGRDLVKIDVDDDYTVKAVQDRISGIQGKDVYINVRIANKAEIDNYFSSLSQPISKTVNIETRGGVPND